MAHQSIVKLIKENRGVTLVIKLKFISKCDISLNICTIDVTYTSLYIYITCMHRPGILRNSIKH